VIELSIIFALSITTSLFIYLYIVQKRANMFILTNTLKVLLTQEIEHKENKTEKEKANEDFLKFVSDSRDLAYQYIESVQEGLKKFIDEVEPQLEYYNAYGSVVEGIVAPHDFALKKISSEFKELKKLLPEDDGKIG
jgi:CRISPR/Cas system CSM-associated protein Csm2 small subunit